MIDRVRKIFNNSGLNKSEIARKLDVTPQYIYKLMNTDAEPSERIILAIEKAFPDINAVWLRTGEGEMLMPRTRETDIAEITAAMFKSKEDDFKYQLMKLIAQMDSNQIQSLRDITEQLYINVQNAKETSDKNNNS